MERIDDDGEEKTIRNMLPLNFAFFISSVAQLKHLIEFSLTYNII